MVYVRREPGGDTENAASGGKASEGRKVRGGDPARGQNLVNPRVGCVLQYTRGSLEEEAVEVVRNHEDGTWSGGGSPFPTETPRVSRSGLQGEDSRRKGVL